MALWYTLGLSAPLVLLCTFLPAAKPGTPDSFALLTAAAAHPAPFLGVVALFARVPGPAPLPAHHALQSEALTMRATFPVAVYAAMLGEHVGGQFLGMAVDTLALGRRILWVPLACSVVLEALVGARFGASRMGRPLSPAERLRLSLHYSLGLAVLSIPLVLWLAASHASPAARPGGGATSTMSSSRPAGYSCSSLPVRSPGRGSCALLSGRRA